jgi:hypothetical protein
MWVVILFARIVSETFLKLRKTKRDARVMIPVQTSSCKVSLLLPDVNETLILWKDFRPILKYEIS